MALNTLKQYFCVCVGVYSQVVTQVVLLLQFSLYHPCFCGTFQRKHSWKWNPYPSDLIVTGHVEMAVFNYQCLKPSAVVARMWRNESGHATKALISGERLISTESILNSGTIGSLLDVRILMCSLFCLTDFILFDRLSLCSGFPALDFIGLKTTSTSAIFIIYKIKINSHRDADDIIILEPESLMTHIYKFSPLDRLEFLGSEPAMHDW